MRAKVQNAITSILDSYFDCKRSEWTSELSDTFQNKQNNMYVHISLVWELNQITLNPWQKPKSNKMRNIHKHLHLPLYTRWMGSLGKMDTSTYESFHKISTTGIWETTSRRNDSLFLEMTKTFIIRRHSRLKTFFCKAICKDNEKNITKFYNVVPNIVTFKSLPNQPTYRFYLANVKETVILDANINWGQICNQNSLNTCKQFYDMLILLDLENLLAQQYNQM